MKTKTVTLSNVLPQKKFWSLQVSKRVRKLKKENPSNPFLSHDEKTVLFLDWKNNGNVKSRDKLLTTLYPLALQLVHSWVDSLGNNNVAIEDLEQEANLALLYSLEHYDPNLGTLPTYFRSRLPMFFFRALKDYGNVIRIPDNILKDISSESKAFDEYVKKHGQYPQPGELVTFKEKQIKIGEKRIDTIVSGNKPVGEVGGDQDEFCELFDLLGTEDEISLDNDQEILAKIVGSLTRREQEIVRYAYYTKMEISEIVYLLKPVTQHDYARVYRRAKNVLKIETDNGEVVYQFFVYNGAKKRKKGEVNDEVISPITHKFLENYQETTNLEMLFSTKNNIKQVLLNGVSIPYICLENDTLKEVSEGETLYKIQATLKAGSVYSLQNYNNILNKIKDKLRKKIIENYEFFK